jgi:hypothetical protein
MQLDRENVCLHSKRILLELILKYVIQCFDTLPFIDTERVLSRRVEKTFTRPFPTCHTNLTDIESIHVKILHLALKK